MNKKSLYIPNIHTNFMKNLYIFFILSFVFSCSQNDSDNTAKLLFKSGFEGAIEIIPNPNIDNIDFDVLTGTDSETNFTWPISILGSSENGGLHYIDDDNRQAIFSEIQTVIGHDGNPTKALYSIENYQTNHTQCPYEITDLTEGKNDLYVKFWMKMDSESLHQIDKWRAIFEYKTKDYAAGTGYRFITYVYTDIHGNPYWHIQGDENPESAIWEYDNYDIPVPENQWFLTEFYWKWSDTNNGRTFWKINNQMVYDHHGATTKNNKPIDFIILTQIYGDANPKHQWIDDIEIWDGLPE